MDTFAENLVKFRNRKGLSQYELSKRLHLTRSQYSLYELGARRPKLEIIQQLADFYGLTVDDLLSSPRRTIDNGFDKFQNNSQSKETNKRSQGLGIFPAGRFINVAVLKKILSIKELFEPQNILGYLPVDSSIVPAQDREYAWVIADGETLSSSSVQSGAHVLLQITDEWNNGDIGAFLIDGENGRLARLMRLGSGDIMVMVDDPNQVPEVYGPERITFIAKAIWTAHRI